MASSVSAVGLLGRRRTRRGRPPAVTALALTVLGAIVLACLGASLIAPYDPTRLAPAERFLGVSASHPFGTDELGRDLFSRILYGGRYSIGIAAGATVVAMTAGAAWGFAAAFSRGVLDELLMRLADVTMAIPQMLLALVLVAAFGATGPSLALIVGALLTPVTARMARSAVLGELQADYCTAAIAYGASARRLVVKELLPNVSGALGVQAAIVAANAIILEAALSFVGLGIQPPDASWGALLQQGYMKMSQSSVYVLFPALAIFVTIWMLNLLADQLGGTDDLRGRRG